MIPSSNGLPSPMATLDDLLEEGDSSEKAYKVFVGHNLGHRTFLVQMPMHEFFGISEVANDPVRDGDAVSQRKLDPVHAHKLAAYILKGLVSAAIARRAFRKEPPSSALEDMSNLLGRQPYMSLQPIVVNVRNCDPKRDTFRAERLVDVKSSETSAFKIFLAQRHVLWVIDGQHRRKAMQLVFEFLEHLRVHRAYPKKLANLTGLLDGETLSAEALRMWEECFEVARTYCTLMVEIHLGLDPHEERQLFHDLNRLGKRVDSNLAMQFDNSNPVNLFIKEQLIDQLGLGVTEQAVKDWDDDDGRLSRKDVVGVNAILFLNRTNINGATPTMVDGKPETAKRFWTSIMAIPDFGEMQARKKTVAAQPVVLKAMAKLVYDFSFSNRRPDDGDELTNKLLDHMDDVDFGHENPMWQYYELSETERVKHGLANLESYLPPQDGANRDLGSFQGGLMRFGAKTNDIYPVLGDMIRWKLGLPARAR